MWTIYTISSTLLSKISQRKKKNIPWSTCGQIKFRASQSKWYSFNFNFMVITNFLFTGLIKITGQVTEDKSIFSCFPTKTTLRTHRFWQMIWGVYNGTTTSEQVSQNFFTLICCALMIGNSTPGCLPKTNTCAHTHNHVLTHIHKHVLTYTYTQNLTKNVYSSLTLVAATENNPHFFHQQEDRLTNWYIQTHNYGMFNIKMDRTPMLNQGN